MNKINFLLLFSLFINVNTALLGQNLPKDWHLSDDGAMLHQGSNRVTGLYNEDKIPQINLIFQEATYWTILTANYQSKKDLMAKMTVDGVAYDSVGVRFKGQTSYGGGPGGGGGAASQKKSFNISMDAFKKNPEKVKGYKTLNLNNSFQDASFMKEVFYFHQIRPYAHSAKANFVHLYINGQDWGLYQNTQQLNGEFLKERFMSNDGTSWRADVPPGTAGGGGGSWGDGKAAMNFLGEDTLLYKKNYTLNGTQTSKSWSSLVAATKVLNQTPLIDLENALANHLDIDRTLWHLASEIAFSDDDSYVFKGKMDYYIYQDAETGRFVPMEYDGNSSCDPKLATWSPFYNETKVNYPLMNRLFAVPALRQRYIAHMKTIISEAFDTDKANTLLDKYAAQIDSIVSKDPKKTTTYAQFQPGVNLLKKFVVDRRAVIMGNVEFKTTSPAIANADYFVAGEKGKKPNETQSATIRSSVSSANGISVVNLYYGTGLYGKFSKTTMFDDGAHDDGAANDGIFAAQIPAQASGEWVRYYLEATAANTSKSVSYLPVGAEHSIFIYQVQSKSVLLGDVVINEIMASNTKTVKDEGGKYADWIELYNRSNQAVNVSDFVLTDNPANLTKWKFAPGTIIPAKGYFIVWADEDSKGTSNHCNFKLSSDGEKLILLNKLGVVQDSITFGKQVSDQSLSRIPNGTGNFVIKAATYNVNNESMVSGVDSDILSPVAMQLIPNPARNEVRILSEGLSQQPIRIFNTFGQLVQSIDYQQDIQLEIAHWQSGIYFVQCGKWTKKLVVTK